MDKALFMQQLRPLSDSPDKPVKHGDGGIDENHFHLAGEDYEGGEAARFIEPGEMLGAQDLRLTGNCGVACLVNAPLAVCLNAKAAYERETLDHLKQVLSRGRFRPVAQPCQQCSSSASVRSKQADQFLPLKIGQI